MVGLRKKLDASLKARIALEALKGDKTVSELGSQHGVHPKLIYNWRKHALDNFSSLFSNKKENIEKDKDLLLEELYKQIGQLNVELNWLKKKSGFVG